MQVMRPPRIVWLRNLDKLTCPPCNPGGLRMNIITVSDYYTLYETEEGERVLVQND